MALEGALFYTDALGITGSNTVGPRADSSEVYEVHHEIYKPTDKQTGRPTGARVHGALKVLKRLDKASPLLFKALCENSNLPEIELKWYQPDPTGATELVHMHSSIIKNAIVTRYEQWLPNTELKAEEQLKPMEWVHFNYQALEETWQDGGITHEDAWTVRPM